jgi:hypothetical protein
MSSTRCVPAAVPSVTHSSVPLVPSWAENTTRPSPIAVRSDGLELFG